MMNDDDTNGGGMSLATGYMLGRMAAESSQTTARFKELVRQRFARPQRVPYDADAVESAIESWKDAVRGRDHTIAHLKARLSDTSADNEALRQRYASAYEENNRLRDQIAKHEHDIELMRNGMLRYSREQSEKVPRLERDIELLQNSIMTLHHQHNEKVAHLEAEITRLKGDS